MKQLILILIILSFPFAVLSENKIKIGVPTALTGGAATYGNDIKSALLFANKHLFGDKYEFLFEDDRCNGKDAVSAVQKLVHQDKVKYIIGFACSGAMLAAAPILEQAKVLTISPSASAPAISQAGDYLFRTWPNDEGASRVLLDYVKNKHHSLGVISEETEYTKGLEEALKSQNTSGLKLLNEAFLPGDSDLRTQLLRLKKDGAEGVFINTQAEAGYAMVLKQLRDMNLQIPVYGVYWPGSSSLLSVAGTQAEGIIFADLPSASDILDEKGMALLKQLESEYGKLASVETIAVCAIEALRSLDQALQSGQDPKTYLYSNKFKGLFGEWSYDRNGDIVGMDQVLKIVKNGQKIVLNSGAA